MKKETARKPIENKKKILALRYFTQKSLWNQKKSFERVLIRKKYFREVFIKPNLICKCREKIRLLKTNTKDKSSRFEIEFEN